MTLMWHVQDENRYLLQLPRFPEKVPRRPKSQCSLPPANVVCEGYVFTPVCHSVHGRGHAWLLQGVCGCSLGGMHGCSWGGGMHGCSRGVCMVARGVHGCSQGACVVAPGGMHGCSWGACMVAPGEGVHGIP